MMNFFKKIQGLFKKEILIEEEISKEPHAPDKRYMAVQYIKAKIDKNTTDVEILRLFWDELLVLPYENEKDCFIKVLEAEGWDKFVRILTRYCNCLTEEIISYCPRLENDVKKLCQNWVKETSEDAKDILELLKMNDYREIPSLTDEYKQLRKEADCENFTRVELTKDSLGWDPKDTKENIKQKSYDKLKELTKDLKLRIIDWTIRYEHEKDYVINNKEYDINSLKELFEKYKWLMHVEIKRKFTSFEEEKMTTEVENDISEEEKRFLEVTKIIDKYFSDTVCKYIFARPLSNGGDVLIENQESLMIRLDHAKEILISRYPRWEEYTMHCYVDCWQHIHNCTDYDFIRTTQLLRMYEKSDAKEREEWSFWGEILEWILSVVSSMGIVLLLCLVFTGTVFLLCLFFKAF